MHNVSIIIPTLNEEKYLPHLLTALQKQTLQPKEIIVADAFSIDKTREVAKSFGCTIVDDDHHSGPGGGRNAGAEKATGDILLFFDADVVVTHTFLEKTIAEFDKRHLDIASCFIKPLSKSRLDHFGASMMDSYFYAMKYILPHAAGYCIFIRRGIHEFIHGFDESLVLAEDHDYVQRASKYGKFGFLRSHKVSVSTRRFREEGRTKAFLKYSVGELNMLFGLKNRNPKYAIAFGKHYEQ
jgi:glycosyltransferase involved in cell wall biosynthesis